MKQLRVLGILLLLVLAFLVVLNGHGAKADLESGYTITDHKGRRLRAPASYLYQNTIDGLDYKSGTMKNPQDLFIDRKGDIYIVDTGNNRILQFNASREFIREFGGKDAQGKAKLKEPQGIFVTDDGTYFIGDTGNNRIAVLNNDGSLRREYLKPQSDLLSGEENANYTPSKIVVDQRGYMYVVNGRGDSRGIMLIDPNGVFQGFFGANNVEFQWQRLILRIFATPEQKKRADKLVPTESSNLFLDKDGFIYSTSPSAAKDQIKKLNPVGTDVFRSKVYGESLPENKGRPRFQDVTADSQGIVTAIDGAAARIYQYDQLGNLLTSFGGTGVQQGQFSLPVSLAVANDGTLYIMDGVRGTVMSYIPTLYQQQVQRASGLYYDGRYVEAADLWKKVLLTNSNLELAHGGMGRAYFKNEQYQDAMSEYLLAYDKDGYSKAFGEYRQDFLRNHFDQVVLGLLAIVAVLWGLVWGVTRLLRIRQPGQASERFTTEEA